MVYPRVDASDLDFLVRYFGWRGTDDSGGDASRVALTAEGRVDLLDLVAVTSNWGKGGRDHRQ